MSISIVIPAYNAEIYLSRTIQSVLAQTHQDWQLIVVNDGSYDRTSDLAHEFAQKDSRISVFDQTNSGVCVARNKGISLSESSRPNILFLDADDLLVPQALTILSQSLEAHPDAPAAHGAADEIDAYDQLLPASPACRYCFTGGLAGPKPHRVIDDGQPTTTQMLATINCIKTTGVVLIRKIALKQVGAWNQTVAGLADHDMWYRLSCLGPIVYSSTVTLLYRRHPNSMSKNGRLMRNANLRMRRLWLVDARRAKNRARHSMILHGYKAMSWLYLSQQFGFLYNECACRRWKAAVRRLPIVGLCALKTLPGAERFILRGGNRFHPSRQQ